MRNFFNQHRTIAKIVKILIAIVIIAVVLLLIRQINKLIIKQKEINSIKEQVRQFEQGVYDDKDKACGTLTTENGCIGNITELGDGHIRLEITNPLNTFWEVEAPENIRYDIEESSYEKISMLFSLGDIIIEVSDSVKAVAEEEIAVQIPEEESVLVASPTIGASFTLVLKEESGKLHYISGSCDYKKADITSATGYEENMSLAKKLSFPEAVVVQGIGNGNLIESNQVISVFCIVNEKQKIVYTSENLKQKDLALEISRVNGLLDSEEEIEIETVGKAQVGATEVTVYTIDDEAVCVWEKEAIAYGIFSYLSGEDELKPENYVKNIKDLID